MEISSESRRFLENLRLYLFSSGKNENDIEDIIDELEDHLHEAEKNGKNIEDIIGKTPKEYMEQIANEIPFDYKGLLKYVPIIIIGAFSYLLMRDALRGELEYSLSAVVGFPFITIFSLFITSVLFKYVSSNRISKMKEWVMFWIISFTQLALFIILFYLDRYFVTPIIISGTASNYIAIIFSIIVFVGIAIWSKTWISIILPIILFLPEFVINKTSLQENTKLLVEGILVPVCFIIYTLTLLKVKK